MQTTTVVKPLTIRRVQSHYCQGARGRHKAYEVDYRCPECGMIKTLKQCTAWPITTVRCRCGVELECDCDRR